jgi:hypothetical protein
LSTTQSLDKAVYEVREDCFVAIDPISLDDMISMVPDDSTDRVNRFESIFDRSAPSGDEVRDRLRGDVRMERAFSTDELRWGSSRPALEFEHWVREDDIPEISDKQRTEAYEVVEDEIGVDLNRYHDHWGNLVIQIEDFRANIEFDDEWMVELNPKLADLDNISVLLERREYGDLLWQDSVDFEGSPDNKEDLRRVVLSYDCENYVGFCQVSQATGSSEEIAKVLVDGEVASREDFPVARKVVTQISVVALI